MIFYSAIMVSVMFISTSRAQRVGEALKEVPFISSKDGLLDTTLTIEYTNYQGAAHSMVNVRLLNGTLPGPMIRVKAADKMRILFQNRLAAPTNPVTDINNRYRFPDYSNLHFHGAHVSGELPSDDTRLKIAPGGEYQYETDFPENHMPGTHWIHPHVHGSSTLQVGAGAALTLIVEDPPNYLSQQVADATEVLLFVQHMSLDFLQHVIDEIGDEQMTIGEGLDPDVSPGTRDYRMINGQFQPTLTMHPGEWQRWRIVYAGWLRDPLDFEIISDSCETQLLAKDGVYITDFPREIAYAPIPPGGRADIMVRCSTEGSFLVVDYAAEVILNLEVTGESIDSIDLEPWSPPSVPQYVQDLRDVSAIEACSCSTEMDYCDDGNFCINGNQFDAEVFVHTIRVGEVVDRTLVNTNSHPYHQHVYPFQLVSNVDNGAPIAQGQKAYFKEGDWHDVIMIPEFEQDLVVRYQPMAHLGRVMLHCHTLSHEDLGMMSQENVVDDTGQCQCDSRTQSSPEPDPIEGPIDTVPAPFCFSANNLVELEGGVQVPMSELKVGDTVKVGKDTFEPVYTFGHRDANLVATYLRITYSGSDILPLEITEDHLVFASSIDGLTKSLPASKLAIGDSLLSKDDTLVTILSIEKIVRTGVYAPFTLSGEIIVSGIKASNYITLQSHSETLVVGNIATPFTYQWLAHAFQAPSRLLYTCGVNTVASSNHGISPFVEYPHLAAKLMLNQHPVLTTLIVTHVVVLLASMWALEALLMSYSGTVGFLILLALLATRKGRYKTC